MNKLSSAERIGLSLSIIIVAAFALLLARPWSARGQGSNTVTTVSAASYGPGLAPEAIGAAFGTKLATQIKPAETVPLPTNLAGTTVKVNDVLAPLFFVSPTQINYLIPPETAVGNAQVVVTSGDGTVSTGTVQAGNVAPGIFTADASGRGVPAGCLLRVTDSPNPPCDPITQFVNNTFAPKPILFGSSGETDFLVFFLTGVRRAAPGSVRVIIGNDELVAAYAGPAPGFVGLDQINVELPRFLSGRGRLALQVKAGGVTSNVTEIEFGGPVVRVATSVAVNSSDSAANIGQEITLTAAVTPNPNAPIQPTGVVQFKDNNAPLGVPAALINGVASLATDALPPGNRLITAEYSGDQNFLPSASAAFAQAVSNESMAISGISQSSVVYASETVVINGSGFSNDPDALVVRVVDSENNETTAEVVSANDSQLVVRLPFGGGAGKLKVARTGSEVESAQTVNIGTSVSGLVQKFVGGVSAPVVGMTVSVQEPSGTMINATTNAEGSFVVKGVTATSLAKLIIGGSASDGLQYPSQVCKMNVKANRDNQYNNGSTESANIIEVEPIPSTTLSARAANPSETEQTNNQVVFNANNSTVTCPPGLSSCPLKLSVLPRGRAPSNLPPGAFSSTIAQVTPFGARLAPGGKLTFPNSDAIPPGAPVLVFAFDQNQSTPPPRTVGQFVGLGSGTVSSDGQRIETPNNAVTLTGYYFVSRQWPTTTLTGRVVEANGRPVRRAVVSARGQSAFTDNLGGFTLRNVPVITPNGIDDQLQIEINFVRPNGSVARSQRFIQGIRAALNPNDSFSIGQDFVLPRPQVNRPPLIYAPLSLVVTEGETRSFPIAFFDPERQPLAVASLNLAFASLSNVQGAACTGDTCNLRLSPPTGAAGNYTLTLRATDNKGLTAVRTIGVIVRKPDSSALIANFQTVTTTEDNSVSITLTTSGALTGAPVFTVGNPARGTLSGTAPNLRYTPNANFNGVDAFSFKFTSGGRESNTATVFTSIIPVNDAPSLAVTNQSSLAANAGETVLIDLAASDPDLLQDLNFTAANLPPGAAFVPAGNSARFFWTPTYVQPGSYTVSFTVTDDGSPALSATVTRTISVSAKWSKTSGPEGGRVSDLVAVGSTFFARLTSTRSLAGTGLYSSTNKGLSWSRVEIPASFGEVNDIFSFGGRLYVITVLFVNGSGQNVLSLLDPKGQGLLKVTGGPLFVRSIAESGGRAYVSSTFGVRVFDVSPDGLNWKEVAVPQNLLTGKAVDSVIVKGAKVFACVYGDGVYVSTNQGLSWAATAALPDRNVAAIATDGAILYAGTVRPDTAPFTAPAGAIFISGDDGVKWSGTSVTNAAVRMFAVSGSTVIGASGGQLQVTSNSGQTWAERFAPNGSESLAATPAQFLIGGLSQGVFATSNGGQTFTKLTSGLLGSHVVSFLESGSRLFAGTVSDGLYFSDNGGQSWTKANGGFNSSSIYGLTVKGSRVFAISHFGGVYFSDDNGKTWTTISTSFTQGGFSLAATGNRLLAGTTANGVFYSDDDGKTWTATNLTGRAIWSFLVFGAKVFAGTGNGEVFVSTNAGATWNSLSNGLPGVSRNLVISLELKGAKIFAAVEGTATGNGVYVTSNDGGSWTKLSFPTTAFVESLAVNGSLIFASTYGSGVFVSSNEGQSWQPLTTLPYQAVPALGLIGSDLIAGTDGDGVYRLANNVQSWSDRNNTLANRFVNSVLANNGRYFAGTLAGLFRSIDEGAAWQQLSNGLPATPNVLSLAASTTSLFAGTFGGGVYRSANNGDSWAPFNTNLANLSVNALAVGGGFVFAATDDGVFRSPEGSSSWTKIATGLTTTRVQALLIVGSNVYAGTDGGGVFVAALNGSSWTPRNGSGGAAIGDLDVTAFGAAANGATIFAGTDGGGGYRTSDGGLNWTSVNSNLPPGLNVYAIAVSGNKVYAGTVYGVFLSEDNGANWKQINAGLLDIFVTGLVVDGQNLIAGTRIGGVFLSRIP